MSVPPESHADGVVLIERRGHVARIILNRPNVLNAVNATMSRQLGAALAEADADPDVRAIVLTGAGRAFCAGMDLKAYAAGEEVHAPGHPEWGFAGMTRHRVSVPLIAAVNGYAAGGGTELVLAADLVVAGRSAVLALPEVKRGLVAAAGGALRLHRQVPLKIALEVALTGEQLPVDRAAMYGLVNSVVDDADVVPAALALAERIVANAPLAVGAHKAADS
jgi:crotonobetainyl-CoA hydratase